MRLWVDPQLMCASGVECGQEGVVMLEAVEFGDEISRWKSPGEL
jgi:hypothetical protein